MTATVRTRAFCLLATPSAVFFQKGKAQCGFLYSNLHNSSFFIYYQPNIQEKNSVALDNFLEEHPLYKEPIHTLGVRPDNKEFSPDIKKITDGFVILNEDLKKLEDDKIPNIFEYDGLHSGTPLRYKPFKGALRSIRWTLRRSNLYWR